VAETAGVQEYLESIYRLAPASSDGMVGTSALAGKMAVSAASASEMLKRLAGLGLVDYRPYAGARLTAEGAREAERVVRYHRLWERFMVDVLGMPWDEVHETACLLEHATTPEDASRLSRLLNDQTTCPHGNPLPGPDDRVAAPVAEARDQLPLPAAGGLQAIASTVQLRLIDAPPGCRGRIASVGEEPELLRYCMSQDLLPGAAFKVVAAHPIEQIVEIEIDDLPVSIRSRSARIKIAEPRRLMVGPRVGANVRVVCDDSPPAGDPNLPDGGYGGAAR